MEHGPRALPFEVRKTWKNHLGNQKIDPLRIYAPATIDEVVGIVRLAQNAGVTVRAVGSGHSWSDVALTDGFLVKTHRLARVPAPEPDFVRPEWGGRRLARVEAGARVEHVNDYLDRNGLGLVIMGGYDQQSVAGVISTSTHGSGTQFGPINDMVRSLDVVAGGGEVQRIEPSDGPTDRAAYEAHHGDRRTLVQDDHVFDAVAVGMGCMGIICTLMLEVRERYFLREQREPSTWAQVRADLQDGGVFERNRHYELIFSPYKHKQDYGFLVTTRNITTDPRHKPWSTRMRNVLVEAAALFPLTPHAINIILDIRPGLAPALLEAAMKALVKKEYDAVSHKVFNIGRANILPAYSAEIGVPMDGRHIEAVERIFQVADERRRLGKVYQSGPLALRFVKRSPAYMSMMHGRDTMMIELIGLRGNDGGYELLNAYEEALYDLGGRPHWGQINTLTGSHDLLASMYPDSYDRWQDVHRRLNPGVFDSPFSKRTGISADRFTP
jgi:L-gulono-1,4-lactone dehydrogenase